MVSEPLKAHQAHFISYIAHFPYLKYEYHRKTSGTKAEIKAGDHDYY